MEARELRARLLGLSLADPPGSWADLGFAVDGRGCAIGGVSLALGSSGQGITGWAVSGLEAEIDGLSVFSAGGPRAAAAHPNGAIGIDHVVVVTPDFDRTASALQAAEMPLRRVISGRGGRQMGFRRLGPTILELVEPADAAPGPARFWGLTVIVDDLDALAERLGDCLGSIHDAVQPGRRIAAVRRSAGLGEAVAFMSPSGAS